MKIIYLFILFLLFNISGFAQSISITGNVKDFEKSFPLEGVKVSITNTNDNSKDSVFTDFAGNWQYDILTSVTGETKIVPTSLQVLQNFPNPFNPSTRINFSIPQDGVVEIFIHNIIGEMIDSKYFNLSAGNYSIDWLSRGSAGVYFYTIKFGEQSITNKMIQLDGGNGIGLSEIRAGISGYTAKSQNTFSIPVEIILSKLGYSTDTITTTIFGGENYITTIQTVHSKYTLIDLHNDVLEVMINDPNYHLADLHNYNHTDIPRLHQGGVDVQFFSIWVSESQYQNHFAQALVMRNLFYSELAANPSTITQARTMQEALSVNSQGKIAAVIGVEGGHHIENNIDKLVTLYNAGMRYLTITWNNSTSWAVSAKDTRTLTDGLTDFGKQVIKKLDSLGVIIDVSHVGIKTIQDILTVTKNPIVATHSGARSLRNHYRNLYDWQIKDIANSGGVIGVVFYPWFLNGSASAVITDVIAHIDHIVNLVGINHVAIGSDFDGIEVTPSGLEDVTRFPDLTLALLQHGYSESDLEKILGGNFKRVFKQVCGD